MFQTTNQHSFLGSAVVFPQTPLKQAPLRLVETVTPFLPWPRAGSMAPPGVQDRLVKMQWVEYHGIFMVYIGLYIMVIFMWWSLISGHNQKWFT